MTILQRLTSARSYANRTWLTLDSAAGTPPGQTRRARAILDKATARRTAYLKIRGAVNLGVSLGINGSMSAVELDAALKRLGV